MAVKNVKIESMFYKDDRVFGNNLTNIIEKTEAVLENCNKIKEESNAVINNPQECEEYREEIELFTKSLERLYMPKANYMIIHADINEKMRAILVDWMVDVGLKFKLKDDTLFLGVNIVDRFLERQITKREQLQLVGVTAMFIASKYEEIYPPEIKDFIYICDNAYTKSEIIIMERQMLKVLNYNLNITSTYRYLKCYNRVINPGPKAYNMALYLIELALVEYKFIKYKPSLCAASALYISNRLINKDLEWNIKAANTIGYQEHELKKCAKELAMMTQGASTLNAVKRKYAQSKYMAISNIKIGKRS